MTSPLKKRFPRELKANAGKYLGIFLMMVIAIGFTSGFLSAASSIEVIINEMDDKYLIENGRIIVSEELSDEDIAAAKDACQENGEAVPTFTKLYSMDVSISSEGATEKIAEGSIARVYEHRSDVDLAAYAQGAAPANANEIALDRVFCTNNNVEVGDTVTVDGQAFTVSGIMTLPDYSALFENNSDFIFNALTYTVAEISPEAFEAIKNADNACTYAYAFTFDDKDCSLAERTDAETEIATALQDRDVEINDLIDADSNKGIGYPLEDVQGDQSMWEVLMFLLIVIMAFMFVVLTTSTIDAESAVIGTLLASGWKKRELIFHYAALPCFIGVLAAAVGNVLGYIVLAGTMQGLYYNSYSLPPYEATWSWRVFSITTVAPLVLLIGITFIGLARRMRATPLQFLRMEKGGRRNRTKRTKKAASAGTDTQEGRSRGDSFKNAAGAKRRFSPRNIELPEKLSFPVRFRLRILLTNLGNFIILFFGIMFASILLLFGLSIMPTMENYASSLRDSVVAEHMYSLKYPLELERSAEQQEAIDAYETLSEIHDLSDMERLGLSTDDVEELAEKAETLEDGVFPVNNEDNSAEAIGQAEKYAVTSLDYELENNSDSSDMVGWGGGKESFSEEITVYGVEQDSRYFTDLHVGNAQALASEGFLDKYDLQPGDTIVLSDKYTDTDYRITINGCYGTEASLTVYMSLEGFNERFGNEKNWFNGWASDLELNLDSTYLASDLTPADMDKIGAQMTNSMGSMMNMIMALAILIFIIFMYLLTKTVIDRSARAISYLKVFGYRNREINRLYIRSLTWTVVFSLVLSQPIIITALTMLFETMMKTYSGNIVVYVPAFAMGGCMLAGLLSYAFISILHMRKIRKVPLEIALKVQE